MDPRHLRVLAMFHRLGAPGRVPDERQVLSAESLYQ